MQLEDKIALVTGAGRGMGRAISLQLAEEGANVAVSDIDASTAEDTAVAIKQMGRESLVLPADIGDLNDINRMFTQAKDAFGRLDVVVNNAGVTKYLDIMDVEEEDWDRIHRVNAKGVFLGTKYSIPEMRKAGGGSIINISSIAGLVGRPGGLGAYGASKGAVRLLTKSTAGEYGPENIRCKSVHPGFIETEMNDSWSEEDRQKRLANTPLQFFAEAEDVAYAVLYLASDESRYVTGSELVIDGGVTAQ